MKSAAPYISAILNPVGKLMEGGASIAGAAQGGGMPGTTISKIPLTRETKALQSLAGRQLAAYSGYRAPSLLEYAASGGQSGQPTLPGMTPYEAMLLQMVSPTGGTIPYYDPIKGGPLTADQLLAGAQEAVTATGKRRTRQLRILGRKERKVERVERNIAEKGTTTMRENKLARLTARRNELLNRFGV